MLRVDLQLTKPELVQQAEPGLLPSAMLEEMAIASSSSMAVTLDVGLWSCMAHFAARPWTFSMELMQLMVWESHTGLAYSRRGLTSAL